MTDWGSIFTLFCLNMKDNQDEMFPVVDEEGNILGAISRGEAHNGSKVLHPVVHLHVFNSKGELYLQKRPAWKDIQPDKWDTAIGGHVDLGENIEQALAREAREELQITEFQPQTVGRYVFEGLRERELVYVFSTVYDKPITPNKEELAEGKFWSREGILTAIGNGMLTPNFEDEYSAYWGSK